MVDTQAQEGYNPEFNPTGIEGGLDTNELPWLPLSQAEGMSIKPLRASLETGFFTSIIKLSAGTTLPGLFWFGGCDLMVLSGDLSWQTSDSTASLEPGIWGYMPANTRTGAIRANSDVEILLNSYSALGFLDQSRKLSGCLTGLDLQVMARGENITLVPSTLADCTQERGEPFSGKGEPLAIASGRAERLVQLPEGETGIDIDSPHFVDTRKVPWISTDALPGMGLKVLRVSEDSGFISLIVRHNGVAPPHTHLGSSDFLVLSGRLGYRAGPPEGYGPGVWIFEPAGARHDETQRVTDEDLIYTANVYGPIIFDSGRGTPVEAVMSWMEYLELARANGVELVRNSLDTEKVLLAWAPLTL
jgi:quercetin dioxygenase-like cupin family protein